MTYGETLDYLFSKLPLFSRVGSQAIKSGLSNIIDLCDSLNNPHQKGKFVHIAGTNGKGSVSHILAAILQSAGYKTGLYTSPHLKDFRERIKIDGKMIEEAEVISFTEKIKPLIEEIKPSFFEITAAMAFSHFAKHETDINIIETGLGGRLDSTNIINPIVSVITNIGLDHTRILGDTLAKIAGEKAGIIKPHTPVIIGASHPETDEVFIKIASQNDAEIHFSDKELQAAEWFYENEELIIYVSEDNNLEHKKYHLDLTGIYQTKNILPVLSAIKIINEKGFHISPEQIKKGLKNVKKLTGLHGRWETIHHHPRIVLDVAHNPDGIKQLLEQIEITTYHHLHIVLGMVKDKDVDTVLSLLPKNARYYFTNAFVPRAISKEELSEKAGKNALLGNIYKNVNLALEDAKVHAHKDDLILVCGSVFLVGELK
ncbi:MAG: bifunctional folylpolyglutamate synthase/dihydrofolate synthase [Sphingobacteriales bacterium]|jgi:dihydrofolate synthase/folylpolyglutamate synthase|nr:bifunctional folylpolyglutamate synthase/dihydrofolate synthase [Sphingobacteriales bacterium]